MVSDHAPLAQAVVPHTLPPWHLQAAAFFAYNGPRMQVDGEGKKFGKSESGAIWLSAAKLSPYKFYQYLFKTTDADVIRFLRMLTFLPLEEVAAIEASMSVDGYQPNTAQRRLAEEVTIFVHGQKGVEVRSATVYYNTAKIRYQSRGSAQCTVLSSLVQSVCLQAALRTTAALKPGSDTELDAQVLEDIAEDAPSVILARHLVLQPVADVMASAGMQPSKGAAKR
jgi:tyrosyl-tRNA synthetase